MKRTIQLTNTLGFVGLAAAVAIGCGGTSTMDDPQPSATGTVEGRVADEGSAATRRAAAEGGAVTAYHVAASGELTMVSDGSVTVGADGRYAIDVDMSGVASDDLVIRAENGGEIVGEAALDAQFDAEGHVTAPPIDGDSTVIADVYVRAKASGEWNGEASPSMIRLFLDAEARQSIQGSADHEAAIDGSARATVAAMAAWEATLTHETFAVAEQDVDAALRFAAAAEADLHAELDRASTEAEEQVAIEAYLQAVVDAHADAGVQLRELSAAALASTEAMLAFGGEVAADARDTFVESAHMLRAELVTRAAAAESLAADAIASAEAELRAGIEAGAHAEAWAAFRTDVEAAIQAALGVSAEIFAEATGHVESSLSTLMSSWTTLSGSLGAAATGVAAAEGVASFYAQATASAQVDALVAAGADQARADAALHVLATVAAAAQ